MVPPVGWISGSWYQGFSFAVPFTRKLGRSISIFLIPEDGISRILVGKDRWQKLTRYPRALLLLIVVGCSLRGASTKKLRMQKMLGSTLDSQMSRSSCERNYHGDIDSSRRKASEPKPRNQPWHLVERDQTPDCAIDGSVLG